MNNIQLNESLWKLITTREREIAADLAEGLNSKQIAEKLCISHSTVEKHRYSLLKKTGFRNTVELIVAMVKGGVI